MECAKERLAAAAHAEGLVTRALFDMLDAGVQNAQVIKAIDDCRQELADYQRTTRFAIRKRQERNKGRQPYRKDSQCLAFNS